MLCGRSDQADSSMPQPGAIPDTQLVFSAELAQTLGLEEAVLVQQLHGLYRHLPATRSDGLAWLHVSTAYLRQLMPFWNDADFQRIGQSLEAQGLLHIDHQRASAGSLLYALAGALRSELPAAAAGPARDTAATDAPPGGRPETSRPPAPRSGQRPARGEGQPLPPDFTPSEDMLELLERFHSVPRAFALQQAEDFILYWRERGSAGHAWQNKFKQHVLFHWARYQQGQGATGGNTGQRGTGTAHRTRDRSLEQDLTDTSWAE
jgi:hypothetical protein